MATTVRKYDNGPNGWTDYDSGGNAVGAGTYNAPGTAKNPFNLDTGAGMNNGSTSSYSSSGISGGSGTSQSSYADKLTDYSNSVAEAVAKAKQDALRQAWEGNEQALNSQNATVDNNYTSAANKLNALQASRLPEYQAQKDATSQEAAAQLRRTQAFNALTGKFNSGYNRSQMNDIGLARQSSLDAVQGSENAFKTDVSNQLSDVDAQRVASLNDIAGKLQLGQKQYNDGTLSLTNQLESEKATGALKAMMDAQAWADTKSQQSLDNSFRQAQFDQSGRLAQLQQDWQEKQFQADQEAQAFNQALQAGQITGTYNGQSTLAAQAQAAEQAYRQAALEADNANQAANRAASAARSGSGGSSSANLSAIKYQDEMSAQQSLASSMQGLQQMANNGSSRSEILAFINSNAADLQANGVPIQDLYKWASSNFTWDKNGDEWYNTADDD